MFCKCGKKIPEKRSSLGYRKCVECSKERAYTAHMVVHHKTGHTFEIVKDDETAALLKSYERNGFSSSRGSTGSTDLPTGSEAAWKFSPKRISTVNVIVSEEQDAISFQAVCELLEKEGKDSAMELAKGLVISREMSSKCFKIAKEIIRKY